MNKSKWTKLVTWAVFALLSINVFWYSMETATNLLRGDDWRFLLFFYKKWTEGTLGFKDLFIDQHPILLHPIVFLLNAEFFSLQMKDAAILGMIAKIGAGALLLWKMFQIQNEKLPVWLSVLFLSYAVLLFFGMNSTNEYNWPLVTYESNLFYLSALGFLVLVDRFFSDHQNRNLRTAAVIAIGGIAMINILLYSTLMRMFLIATFAGILPITILEKKNRNKRIAALIVIALIVLAYPAFIKWTGHIDRYALSLGDIEGLLGELFSRNLFISYGLAAGVLNLEHFRFPTFRLTVIADLCLFLVAYSIFIFYKDRMWKKTVFPIVLILYMLFSMLGAMVFRKGEVANGWPLFIPRYFAYYHMGWVGVTWIFYSKLSLDSSQKWARIASATLLVAGISVLVSSIAIAWKGAVYITASNEQSVAALCGYATGKVLEEEIPTYIRGGSFTAEGVSILQANHLNVFFDTTLSPTCLTAAQ
jgi:hypothetical protein